MPQWSLTDRTLYAKLVYYGPALGGKTTNLRALHQATDPGNRQELVSVNTADDRTLFFDLLPFELGSVLGYKVAIKLFTVPGQIRYDATRRAVLSGADAVVFVADSAGSRREDNRAAWINLKQNMRSAKLDPEIPVLVQLNKRDLPDAVRQAAMAAWFGLPESDVYPATARAGLGVVETFIAASHMMLDRIVSAAGPSVRRSLDVGDLKTQLDAAFAPCLARAGTGSRDARLPAPAAALVLPEDDLLASAVGAGAALGASLADERACRQRLEREAELLRRLSDVVRSTEASFDETALVDHALQAAIDALGASGAALCGLSGGTLLGRRVAGAPLSRLLDDSVIGGALAPLLAGSAVRVIDDPDTALAPGRAALHGVRALAIVPVEPRDHTSLIAVMPAPDGVIRSEDVRFLANLAGHLAVGLEKLRIHEELRAQRDRLEQQVAERTRALQSAYEDLKTLDRMKDRFLANVSHEMRSPLTAIIGAGTVLGSGGVHGDAHDEMVSGILRSAETMARLVDSLLRAAQIEAAAIRPSEARPAEIVAEALRLAGAEQRVTALVDPRAGPFSADASHLPRALAHLLDNAVKFGPPGGPVELEVRPCLHDGAPGLTFAVLDRGPGVPVGDVDRAFARFEQGGDPLTAKPPGFGLGLYEARAVARAHGGTVVYRPRPGGGSEFRLTIPVRLAVPSPARRQHA